MASVINLSTYLEEQRALVDAELERQLPPADAYPAPIHLALRYSVFAGGKRLRPILCLEAGRLFDGQERALLRLGCALEMIHTYSLIHDDLPALDNDDLRRGKPTSHKAFGEATAILAGDALLTLAFETMATMGSAGEPQDGTGQQSPSPAAILRVIYEVARAVGTRNGMVGGQVMDLEGMAHGGDATTLEYIHNAKTGAFIRASVRAGALSAGATEADLVRVSAYGEKVGLAFQIADDLLDVLGSRQALGKEVGKDGQQKKITYPSIHGVEKSQRIASRLVQEASQALDVYGGRSARLRELAHFLIERTC